MATQTDLRIDLGGGEYLYGFACPEHGLRQVARARPEDVIRTRDLRPQNGAPPPSPVDLIACDLCERMLVWAGGGDFAPDVPDEAADQLREIAAHELAEVPA